MPLIHLNTIPFTEIAKGYLSKLVHSEHMTFSFVHVKAGESLPEHQHLHEQVSIILEGRFRLCLDGIDTDFGKDEMVIIPSGMKHSGFAITDCRILDVFNPVREDYRQRSSL